VLVEVVPAVLASGGDPITDTVLVIPLLLIAAVLWWSVRWLVRGFAVLARALLGTPPGSAARRIAELTKSRAATVDAQAAELRRIERDLHDGAQARLAAVGMTLGLASQALRTDTLRAGELLEEARADAGRALAELRDLVRGIHPPVLADRGLAGGLEAAALLCPVPVTVVVELAGRPQAPVESAHYFATAEALANVGRHSGASRARLRACHDGAALHVVLTDDGRGGADPRRGTGLRGIERRLAAFDGTLHVSSPTGGPTELTMELPCVLNSGQSSPKTTSSSATA
jgi:signal transduction histidine kinase